MANDTHEVRVEVNVPEKISEMGLKFLEEGGNVRLLEMIMKIIFHAMVDDVYYAFLPTVEKAFLPKENRPNIKVVFKAKDWECSVLGLVGPSSPLGRINTIADCHGMGLEEYLEQCLHCGLHVMQVNAKKQDAKEFPDIFL